MRSNILSILTVTFAFAFAFTIGCGEHTLESIFGEQSSDSVAEISSSSLDLSDLSSSSDDESDENGTNWFSSDDINNNNGNVIIEGDVFDIPEPDNPHAIVEPLIQTRWDQGSPFNDSLPLVNGERPVTGCGRIAYAQLLKYHNHPVKPDIDGVDSRFTYDWNNMLNIYYKVNFTEQQHNAVTVLLYHIFLAGTGPTVLVKNFGYDKSVQRLYRKYYDDNEWEAIIREQLDARLPIYYSGNDPESSHAFYVDGYDNMGRFHIGRGALPGKEANSWFNLNNINPRGKREWYNNQAIVINIKPDSGSIGSNAMALDSFTVGKASVGQNELFNIRAKIKNLGIFPGGQVGTAVIGSDGNIVKYLGIRNFTSSYNMDVYIPEDINLGQYTLRIATRFEGGEWKLVKLSDREANIPNSIKITVNPPAPGAPGGGYGLGLTKFTTSKSTVSQNELFTVSSTLKNFAPTDTFPGGQVGAALVNSSGNIAAVVGIANFAALNPSSSRSPTLDCFVPDNVTPGQYKLRMVVKPTGKDWRVATMSSDTITSAINFTVKAAEPGAIDGVYGLALSEFSSEKNSVFKNEQFNVNIKLKNVSTEEIPGNYYYGVALIDNNGKIVEVLGNNKISGGFNAGAGWSVTRAVACKVSDAVNTGSYRLRAVIKTADSNDWRFVTMSVGSVPNAIDFTVMMVKQ